MNEPKSVVKLGDCMEFMKELPDNYVDLACLDIPYGIDAANMSLGSGGGVYRKKEAYQKKDWDKELPSDEYFYEIFRISKNQIFWGANHFIEKIPYNSSCWIVWDKNNGATDFADCELAWTSFNMPVRKFKFTWSGFIQGNMKDKEKRIHPTQKPRELYAFCYKLAKLDKKSIILDTHTGSQSSRIAAYKLGFDFIGYEIDPDYFKDGCERFEKECKGVIQQKDGVKLIQQTLF